MSDPRTAAVRWAALVSAACLAAAGVALSDEAVPAGTALRVGKLHVGDGTVVENAVVIVEGGRFSCVGTDAPPAGTRIRELPHAVACPGFVDAATRLGLAGGAVEDVEALTPLVRAADAFDPYARTLRDLAAAGTTTVGLLPAPGNVAAGRAGAAALTAQGGARVLLAEGAPVFAFMPPALRADRVPATLAGARLLLETAFQGAIWQAPNEPDVFVRPEELQALRTMSPGPALVWVDTAAAARVAVTTLREKRLVPMLVGLVRAADEADALAALGVTCLVTGLSPDDPVARLAFPGRLHAAKVEVVLSTAAPERSARSLRMALSLAVAHGLPADAALAAVTGRAAAALGVDDQVGRVAPGLRADLVVLDGEPWEVRSRMLLVLAGGHVAFDLAYDDGSAK